MHVHNSTRIICSAARRTHAVGFLVAFVMPAVLGLGTARAVGDIPAKVFILAGQSNAVGFGSNANLLPPELYAPQADVLFWFEEGPYNAVYNPNRRIRSDVWIALQYQSDSAYGTFGGPVDGFGPELTLGHDLTAALPDEQVAIVKFAINATSLADDWDPESPGSLYDQLGAEVDDALVALTGLGYAGEIAGVFWMQGEWDALNATDAAAYEANLTVFVQRIRREIAQADTPFVFGRLNADIYRSPYGISAADLATVRAAQEAVAAVVPATAMVDTDDLALNGDWIHFSADGQIAMGERFAAAYMSVVGVAGDLDGDGDVDFDDLNLLLASYGADGGGDLDGDGDTDFDDLNILLANYGHSSS